MPTHKRCCKNLSVPKTPAELAALPYPPNQTTANNSILNRVQNPAKPLPPFKQSGSAKPGHQVWWFGIAPGTPLLDGSGDGVVRGWVRGCSELRDPYGVCLDAASFKYLKRPAGYGKKGAPDPMPCALTWKVVLDGSPTPAPGEQGPSAVKNATLGTGWIPIESIVADQKWLTNQLQQWACCIDTYASWAEHLTKGGAGTYKFRSSEDLDGVLGELAKKGADISKYFKDGKKGGIRRILEKSKGKQANLCNLLGVVKHCAPKSNVLTDYLTRGSDGKPGAFGGKNGYINFNPNASWNAPIPIDTFPAHWKFHRVQFKKPSPVLSSLYEVRAGGPAGDPVGQAIWYFGYVDVDPKTKKAPSDKSKYPGRRYGWVPALALIAPKSKAKKKTTTPKKTTPKPKK